VLISGGGHGEAEDIDAASVLGGHKAVVVGESDRLASAGDLWSKVYLASFGLMILPSALGTGSLGSAGPVASHAVLAGWPGDVGGVHVGAVGCPSANIASRSPRPA
jgi:hypothetical protein